MVTCFRSSSARSPSNWRIPASVVRGGLEIEPPRFGLHRSGLPANGLDLERAFEPDRLALDESLDVLLANQRNVFAKSRAVEFKQSMPMPGFFFAHPLKCLGRRGIGRPDSVGKIGINPPVFLLLGDGQRQDFTFRELLK